MNNGETIFILTISLISLVCPTTQVCSLKMKTDFPDYEPIILHETRTGYELIKPTGDAVVLGPQESVSISCPGARNTITSFAVDIALATCYQNTILNVFNIKQQFNTLGCSSRVTGEVSISSTQCGGTRNGVILLIGHKINQSFAPILRVCYDNQKGEALYAVHVIYGSSINYSKTCLRPTFKVGGLAPGITAKTDYEVANQLKTFTDTLGSSKLAAQYIYKNSYLAKGHLAPDGDFVFGSSKCSSYFYVNTVPQWQSINNGNWKSLELAIRSSASAHKTNFKVVTGGHKTLSLEDLNNKKVKIYLNNNSKLPVPKFLWKIVISMTTRKAIAFVNLNNPFIKSITNDTYLCNNICKANGWGNNNWDNPAKGLLYCCTVSDLKNIHTIPDITNYGILQK